MHIESPPILTIGCVWTFLEFGISMMLNSSPILLTKGAVIKEKKEQKIIFIKAILNPLNIESLQLNLIILIYGKKFSQHSL